MFENPAMVPDSINERTMEDTDLRTFPQEEAPKVSENAQPTEESTAQVSDMLGIVTDCKKLNIRETPEKTGNIIGELHCNDEVIVDPVETTDDFYKIFTVAGIEGFCMKQFISIK